MIKVCAIRMVINRGKSDFSKFLRAGTRRWPLQFESFKSSISKIRAQCYSRRTGFAINFKSKSATFLLGDLVYNPLTSKFLISVKWGCGCQ